MKCVCGYENRHGECDDNFQLISEPDKEKFMRINCHATMELDNYRGEEKVYLYACPKCNTVQGVRELFV